MRAGASACFHRLSWCYYLRSVLLYPRCGLEICGKKRREAAGVFMRLPTGLGAPPFVHGRQTWYNDCAERNPARQDRAAPLRGDCTGKLRLEKKMSPEAPLSSRRTQYNDCAERNPARQDRAAPRENISLKIKKKEQTGWNSWSVLSYPFIMRKNI